MTGPIPRVTCERCGGTFARRRDGTPYTHVCWDGQSPPSMAGRRRCRGCGMFLNNDAAQASETGAASATSGRVTTANGYCSRCAEDRTP